MAILRTTENAMERAVSESKVIEKKSNREFINLLSLKETFNRLFKGNRVQWYGYALRRDNNDTLRRTSYLKKVVKRGRVAIKNDMEKPGERRLK